MSEQGEKRLIDGHYASINKIIARCHLAAHRGYLTKNLVKSHDCINKKCPFFEKTNLRYWKALESSAKNKVLTTQEKRLNKKEAIIKESRRDAFIKKTLEDSGHIYVTSVKEEKYLFTISYIYDKRVDLSLKIRVLRERLRKPVRLKPRTGSEEAIEALIRKPRRETRKVTDLLKAPKVGVATKKRFISMGIFCLEDLIGRNGDTLYKLDCEMSGEKVSRRYLAAYRSAVEYANTIF